jgi:uncharacterized protein YecT (DUF1311 family)
MAASPRVLRLVAAVLPLTVSSAPAGESADPILNTNQKSECWARIAEESRRQVEEKLRAASAAAAPVDIYVQDSQVAWEKYVDAQCDLEADATLGSAAAYVVFMCRDSMNRARAAYLDRLIGDIDAADPVEDRR